jgi:hypothetical protein
MKKIIKRKNNKGYDKAAHSELSLFIDNDYPTYQKEQALVKNYKKKMIKGKFDMKKAEKGVFNLLVVPSARKYAKEYGGNSRMFDSKVRKGVAKSKTRQLFYGLTHGEY